MNVPDVVFPNLNIQINNLSRVAFTISIGDFTLDIYWYGVIIVTAIFLAYLWAIREAKLTCQDTNLYADFLPITLITCIIGARFYYVIFSWDNYKDNLWDIFAIREGGLAIYGAVIAAVATAYVYTKIKKVSFYKFTDTAVPSLVLGQAIGRWGNFFNREAFGGFTNSLFAMRYLKSQVDYIPQSVLDNAISIGGTQYIQVHPAFLYESLWNIALFIFLQFYKKRKKFEGELIYIYLIGYGIGRFFIESIRTDQLILFGTGIPVSMLLSALVAVASIGYILFKRFKDKVKGFTIMELTVAIGVIVIMTAILLPNVINYLTNARAAAAHANAKTAYNAAVQIAATKPSDTGIIKDEDKASIRSLLTGDIDDIKIKNEEPKESSQIGKGNVYIYTSSGGMPEAAYFETISSRYPVPE